MPNVWTHIFFAEDICQSLPCSFSDSPFKNALFLGAQGPDPFFYYRFWASPSKQETGHAIGEALHTKQCGPFLIGLIEQACRASPTVRTYVTGFITHHILDRTTHPYIHYRAGYQGSNHQKLETIIDTKLALKYRKKEIWKHSLVSEIDYGECLPAELLQLLEKTIYNYYPGLVFQRDDIQLAYQDMLLAHKLFADPLKLKNKLLGKLIHSYSHQPIRKNIDYLNEQKKQWIHPATGQAYFESFEELYATALKEGTAILEQVLDYWKSPDENKKMQLVENIGNISYDTGTAVKKGLKNHFAVPIV